jgi:fatty-acid peroxygenase
MTDGPLLDSAPALLAHGYAWLPDLRRRTADGVVRARLMGQLVTGLCGPEAARFFYDERNVRRSGAIPGMVQNTLFGHGAVHTLDGDALRARKSLFLSVFRPPHVAELVARTGPGWSEMARGWVGRDVVLFDEAAHVLANGVAGWAGVPPERTAGLAGDCVAMVDGFATLGPRHWRARAARKRQEHRLGELVTAVRDGTVPVPAESAVAAVAAHRDPDGQLLDPHTAAVELLNVIRPTVAVAWFVAFAAHALHRWPAHRTRLARGDEAFALAFVHEIRRFYPFAPFIGGRATRDVAFAGHDIPAGSLVLLDLYGQNHDAALWPDPYRFDPERFLGRHPGPYELVPQGAGDTATGHRCPGEGTTVALLTDLSRRLARLEYTLPPQDLTISLARVPARPRSGVVVRVKPDRSGHPRAEEHSGEESTSWRHSRQVDRSRS